MTRQPDPPDEAALRALAEQATPGPWKVCPDETRDGMVLVCCGPDGEHGGPVCVEPLTEADAAFIAASREGVPAVLATLADLRARLAAVDVPRIDPDTDDTMGKTIPITERRLFDLVRYQRRELLDAGLITMGEWTWLTTGATPDVPGAGSPSRKRLEEYDEIRARLAAVTAENEGLRADILAAEWNGADAQSMPACAFCGCDRPSSWPDVGDEYEPHDVDCVIRRLRNAALSAPEGR